ncbi:Peptidoglycan D,D-transpeptidase FtsI [Streptomyces badius]
MPPAPRSVRRGSPSCWRRPCSTACAIHPVLRNSSESQRTQISPKSIYNGDDGLRIRDYTGKIWLNEDDEEWRQTNDGNYDYGEIDLRTAMEKSANSPFVQLGMDVGTDKVKDVAVAAGLKDDAFMADATVPSFSIGTSSPSAIRMAGAYATFATSGQQNDTYSVTEVKREGEVVFQHKKKPRRAFSPMIADNVTDVLKNVVENGTGEPARLEGREAAGKTGTTDGNRSAWFVGYTPQISTAISMFRLDDDETNKAREFDRLSGDMQYLEYPVLTGVFMQVAAWLTLTPDSDPIQQREQMYWMVNAGMLMICAAVIAVCTVRTHRRRPWDGLLVALAPAFVLTATINWDLLAVALTAAAMLTRSRGRVLAFGILIGLATAAKLYPVLLLGPLLVLCWRAGR